MMSCEERGQRAESWLKEVLDKKSSQLQLCTPHESAVQTGSILRTDIRAVLVTCSRHRLFLH